MKPGVLLIHGFTGTPDCMESLAAPFTKAGWEVERPLLAGHGLHESHLHKVTRHDWYASVVKGFESLAARSSTVFVAGLSLGGLMSLRLAEDYPDKIQALACLATPVFFTDYKVHYSVASLRRFPLRFLYHTYRIKKKDPAAINDPIGREAFIGYDRFSVKSLFQVWDEMRAVRHRLAQIKHPALIVWSEQDQVVSPKSAQYLKTHLHGQPLEEVVLKHSNHVLTMDYEKDLVSARVFEFFTKILGSAS